MTPPNEEVPPLLNNADEAAELVSEFPPPPYYYTQAAAATATLTPPPIPHDALQHASIRALEEMTKKKEEADRNRMAAESGGKTEFLGGDAPDFKETSGEGDHHNMMGDEEVAVFGEYVEVCGTVCCGTVCCGTVCDTVCDTTVCGIC